jgi:hypothetical protein
MPASRTVSRLCQLVTALPSESASRESTQTQSRRPCRAPSGQCPTPIGLGHFSDAEPLPVQIEERLRAGFPCNRVLTVRSCLTAPSLEVRAVVAALAQDSQVRSGGRRFTIAGCAGQRDRRNPWLVAISGIARHLPRRHRRGRAASRPCASESLSALRTDRVACSTSTTCSGVGQEQPQPASVRTDGLHRKHHPRTRFRGAGSVPRGPQSPL